MRPIANKRARKGAVAVVALVGALVLGACSAPAPAKNLAVQDADEGRTVNFFSPMEKISPDTENTARTASDLTIALAEERLGLTLAYHTYTAENYQDKTYDEVCLERARNNSDDLYLLNTDTIVTLGSEGHLADLSGLSCAQNLREVVRTANTVDGKLVAIPQEVVAYGLFVNKDIFDECELSLPNTPEEFLECCRVLKEKGYETPIGANRWWLETFVFAQAYADLYNGGDVAAEVQALNAGEGEDFMAGTCPIVMAYWGAANTDTAYGSPSFNMEVIGFPSARGQMPVLSMTGCGVGERAEHRDEALEVVDVICSDEALQLYAETNRVISPSKNVEVECVEALRPLNDLVQADTYVLASNAGMDVEQWGNTCLIVRDLLGGASVDECMAKLDALQDAA